MVRRDLKLRRFEPGIGLVVTVVLLSMAFSLSSRAEVPHLNKRKDEYKRQVEQLEEVSRVAQLKGDVEGMDKLLADDYVGITMSGQVVTKMQQLERMRNRNLVLTRIDLDEMKVKLIGPIAIVTSLVQVEGSDDGVPLKGQYRYTRVYARSPSGTWKITNFEATRVGSPPGRRHGGPHPPE